MNKILITVFCLLVVACSNKENPQLEISDTFPRSSNNKNELSILVISNDGSPIEQALVYLESEQGIQEYFTDEDGILKIPKPSAVKSITLFKENFVTQTHLQPELLNTTFQLQKIATQSQIKKEGTVSGFTNLRKDGFIDFSLVIPNFNRMDLLKMDLSKMISPELQELSILGFKFSLPSNIYLPKQSENYGIIGFTVEKPFFRMLFDFPGKYFVTANRGRFNFRKVSDQIQKGKSYFEVVNDFELNFVGFHSLDTQNSTLKVDLPATTRLEIKKPIRLTQTVSSGRYLYAASIQNNNEKFSVLDIKLKDNTQTNLSFLTNENSYYLLANAGFEKITPDISKISESISTLLTTSENLNNSKFLDLIPTPKLSDNGIVISLPKLPQNVQEHSMKLTLSDIESQTTDVFHIERKKILWEVYSPNWLTNYDLPIIEKNNLSKFKRWEVILYGKENSNNSQNATHMVRNSVDFN